MLDGYQIAIDRKCRPPSRPISDKEGYPRDDLAVSTSGHLNRFERGTQDRRRCATVSVRSPDSRRIACVSFFDCLLVAYH